MQRQHYVTPLTYEEAMEFWNLTPYSEVEALQIELEKERAEKERLAREEQEKEWREQVVLNRCVMLKIYPKRMSGRISTVKTKKNCTFLVG